jgi:uncharacterized membrane protein YccC
MRAAFDRLRTERILADGEAERLARELDAARVRARAVFGTDDEGEIRRLLAEAEARDAALADAFEAALRDVEARLAALDEGCP